MHISTDTNLSGFLNTYFRPCQCSTYQSFSELAATTTVTEEKDQNNCHQTSKASCDDTQGYGSLVGRTVNQSMISYLTLKLEFQSRTDLFPVESSLAVVFVLLLLIDIVCVAAETVTVNNDVLTDVGAIADDCSAEA